MDNAVRQLDEQANIHGRNVPVGSAVGTQEEGEVPFGQLHFLECPIPTNNRHFTWSLAHEVAISLRQFYRARGGKYVQFMIYKSLGRGPRESPLGGAAVGHVGDASTSR